MDGKLYNKIKDLATGKMPEDEQYHIKLDQLAFYTRGMWPDFKFVVKKTIWMYFRYKVVFALRIVLTYTLLLYLGYIAYVKVVNPVILHKYNNPNIVEIYVADLRPFEDLITAVAMRESGGNYDTISVNGMLGAFQFDPTTLRSLGYKGSTEYFLHDKELQRSFFKLLLMANKTSFKKYIDKYDGKKLKGVRGILTESGILLMLHLQPKDVILFLESNGNILGNGDGNKITVNIYGELFSGYTIPF